MKFELIAKEFTYVDSQKKERKGYNFFLKRDDGFEVRISKYHNEFDGKTYDTQRELLAMSTIVKE